ncbi:MAG TPA: hypothetical protein VI541_04645 [Actinomycetota bacterium]|nr:hypothetical protein [Actinomycetota bacterium]
MTRSIEQDLDSAEAAVAQAGSLKETGFWRAVAELRSDPALSEKYASRVARIDRAAFEKAVKLRAGAGLGVAALALATAAGVALVFVSGRSEGLIRDALFLAGFGALDVATHSLAHWVVGRAVGIRFTHVFIGGPPPPRPGLKSDYESYLRTAPRRRALMHASGAVVTKLIPFALVPVAWQVPTSTWVVWVLLVVGVGQIITDILFSTKTSDWKKFRREWRAGAK